jgi:hypothetical protein
MTKPQRQNDPLTFFAVVHDNTGNVLDAYPEERAKYRRCEKGIIGEYRSEAEAFAAIHERLSSRYVVVRGAGSITVSG